MRLHATIAALVLIASAASAQTIGAGQCCECAAALCTDFQASIGAPCIAPCTLINNAVCANFISVGAACLTFTPTRTPTLTPTPTRTPTLTPSLTPTPTRTFTPTPATDHIYTFCLGPTPTPEDIQSVEKSAATYCPIGGSTTDTQSFPLVGKRSFSGGDYTVATGLVRWLTGPTLALTQAVGGTGTITVGSSTLTDDGYSLGEDWSLWNIADPGASFTCLEPSDSPPWQGFPAIGQEPPSTVGTWTFPLQIAALPTWLNTGTGDGYSYAKAAIHCAGDNCNSGNAPTGLNEVALTEWCFSVYVNDVTPTPTSPTSTPAPTSTPIPGCCGFAGITVDPFAGATCLDHTTPGPPFSSLDDCIAVLNSLPTPLPGTPTPYVVTYNGAATCATPGDVTSACALGTGTATPAVTPTPTATGATQTPTGTPSITATITQTPTVTDTPSVTPTITTTATPTCFPQFDKRGVPDLTLCNQACVSPPCDGTYVPAYNEPFGRVKVMTCEDAAGTSSAVPLCVSHTGYYSNTPIPLGTPVACPGKFKFVDTFEKCTSRITACSSCRVTSWIDRLPDAVGKVQP